MRIGLDRRQRTARRYNLDRVEGWRVIQLAVTLASRGGGPRLFAWAVIVALASAQRHLVFVPFTGRGAAGGRRACDLRAAGD